MHFRDASVLVINVGIAESVTEDFLPVLPAVR